MILSTSMSEPPAPRLLTALPSTIGDVSMARNPLEEAEQMCSSFMGEYAVPTSPCGFDLIQDFKIDCPEKELWHLLPTPPRSPDRSDYASPSNGPDDATTTSAATTPCVSSYPSGGSISQAWAGFGMDDWGYFDDSACGVVPAADDQDALCAILFEHDDLIDQLLRDDTVFNSVLDGAEAGGFDGDELPVEDWSSSTAPTQPAVKSELLHDCMWSGQCTDDCKQKAAREKREALAATPTSSLDAVAPASAMTSADEDAVVPLLRGTAATSSGTIDDESVATAQCVDPSSVLGYTPLSDHSYHQAQSAAPPTPPDSPRVSAHQHSSSLVASGQSAATSGGASGCTSSPPILLVRSRNGVWKREVVVSDTPSESDDDDEEEEPEKQNDGDDDDSDDDDDEEDEEIDVVTVVGERHHAGRQGMPAVVALPTHGPVGTIRASHVTGVRSRNIVSAPASPAVVASRMTSSGRVVTPSQKLLSTGPTSRRRRGPHGASAAHHSTVNGGKRRRARHGGHHLSTPQAKRSRRDDDDDDDDSCFSTTPSTSGRRSHHHHSLSQLPPSAKRNEHNTMERKRRDDLRVAFQQLRVQVPSLADNKKAAKVTILSEAATFVTKLFNESTHLQKALWRETQRLEYLQQQLALLQRPSGSIRQHPRYRR